jgi:hypothetical protein
MLAMDKLAAQAFSDRSGLGTVQFEGKTSRNGGNRFEVGYVVKDGERVLFCKRQPSGGPGDFYLCNEFRGLTSSDCP